MSLLGISNPISAALSFKGFISYHDLSPGREGMVKWGRGGKGRRRRRRRRWRRSGMRRIGGEEEEKEEEEEEEDEEAEEGVEGGDVHQER